MAATSTVRSVPGSLELIGRVEVEQTPAVSQPTVNAGGVTCVTNPPVMEVGCWVVLEVTGAEIWVMKSTRVGEDVSVRENTGRRA
jgi:hypothetical protein